MTESQLLYCALEVINQIQFVGITEKMLESVNTFFEMNNISPVESLENLNASNTALDINESTVKKIAKFNQADIELYDYALEKLQKFLLF